MPHNILHVDFNNAEEKEMPILSAKSAKKLGIAENIGIICYTKNTKHNGGVKFAKD